MQIQNRCRGLIVIGNLLMRYTALRNNNKKLQKLIKNLALANDIRDQGLCYKFVEYQYNFLMIASATFVHSS